MTLGVASTEYQYLVELLRSVKSKDKQDSRRYNDCSSLLAHVYEVNKIKKPVKSMIWGLT
jgi:hypothetical protein